MLLEIAVFNYQSAIDAANAGADRLEVCSNYLEGGITASYGMLKQVRDDIQLPIFSIIRPRGGNFVYSQEEFAIMKSDVLACKNLGFDGVVLGMLKQDNTVNINQLRQLVNLAYPLDVTFHRAFDKVTNPQQALEEIIDAGCTRILTSGLQNNALDGATQLSVLIKQANERIIILPGGNIRSEHIVALAKQTNANEFHSSVITNATTIEVNTNEIKLMKSLLNEM